jgi:hypothetical protein
MAERIYRRLRIRGMVASVWLEQLGEAGWQWSWYTSAAGHGGVGRDGAPDRAVATERLAIDNAVLEMRRIWEARDVPLPVRLLDEFLDRWE